MFDKIRKLLAIILAGILIIFIFTNNSNILNIGLIIAILGNFMMVFNYYKKGNKKDVVLVLLTTSIIILKFLDLNF